MTATATPPDEVSPDTTEVGTDDFTAPQVTSDLATLTGAREVQLAALAALRAPFPPHQIGKKPQGWCSKCSQAKGSCGQAGHEMTNDCPICHGRHSRASLHLDFVGHAALTARLLDVDPLWDWDFLNVDASGLPVLDRDGNMWITLTVAGMTRKGVGDGKSAKERIGDALRNAGMRFGMALELWHKGGNLYDDSNDRSDERTESVRAQERAADPEPDPAVLQAAVDDTLSRLLNATSAAEVRDVWQHFARNNVPNYTIEWDGGSMPLADAIKKHGAVLADLEKQATAGQPEPTAADYAGGESPAGTTAGTTPGQAT